MPNTVPRRLLASGPPTFTAELARTVVGQLAPEELPGFDLLARPYLTGVDTSARSAGLEFGVVEAVREAARQRAVALGVPAPLAETIADSVVGALVLGPTEDQP